MAKRGRDGSRLDLTVADDGTIEISNQFEAFKFELGAGKFSIIPKGNSGASIRGAFSRVVLSDGAKFNTSDKWATRTWEKTRTGKGGKQGICLEVSYGGSPDKKLGSGSLILSAEVFAKNPAILLGLQLKNSSGKPVRVKEFQPLVVEVADGGSFELGSGIKTWRFLKNGYQTSTPCNSLSLTELDKTCSVDLFRNNYNPRSRLNPVKGEFESDWVTAFKDNASGNSAVVGFVTMTDNMCQVDFKVDDAQSRIDGLWARSVCDDIICDHGGSLKSEKALVDLAGQVNEALERYAGCVSAAMNAVPWKKVLTGWCSWYEFFERISEELILNVVEYYRKNREKYAIDFIQVDDGYFVHRGDWTTPSELFPHGMKFIADKIKAAGFKPGIWLSPFQISGGSKLFKEHPDWTIKDKKGSPLAEGFDASMKYSYYCLDCTNPEVIKWIKSLFKVITAGWGYEYLKIDFLYAAAADGTRHDNNATRGQALRAGLKAIRETVGDKTPILGCLAPIGQAVGMVNSYRVSPDTATRWKSPWPFDCGPALRDAMRNTILRYFMHNQFWANDPDCVIARRGKERSEYPKSAEIEYLAQGGTISEEEVRFEFTVLGILGGPLIYSDDPIHLPPEREKYLPLLLPPYEGKARVVDLLEEALPRILDLRISRDYDKWDLVGLLNWGESPSDAQLEFTKIGLKKEVDYHVFSFWDERYLGRVKDGVVVKNIPAHSASLLSIREARIRPQLVSSNIHITQGAAEVSGCTWNEKTKALEVTLNHPGRRSGRIFVHVPPPFKFRSITPEDTKLTLQKAGGDETLLTAELDFKQTVRLSITFD
ncbi:MAG: glycoside hydrolase family 36 protein [Promethearchaeati archaeon SRVP18_Atabeyarchaeia-1]